MTLTTHALVGVVAASFFPEQPYLAFAAGVVSHFAIDALPHWDYKLWLRSLEEHADHLHTDMRMGKDFWHDFAIIAADALVGFVLTFVVAWLLNMPLELALIGAGAGLYPDLLSFAYFKARHYARWLANAYEPVQRFHKFVQWKELHHIHWTQGIGMQGALVAVVVALAALI